MADTVEVVGGSYDATVATDDCGVAGHAQIVKLAIATDGSATLIPADANGLKVQAGTNLNTSALATEATLAGVLTSANFAAAFGTAGTADSQVLSVQGIASMTPVSVQSNGANLGTETTLAAVLTSANFAAAFGTAGTADTQVMSVQGIASMTPVQVSQATAGNLNMTEASAAAIKTAVETIDNAISGSEMQVDVVGALPAGTNAIGKLAANSGVDIGDVDVTSIAAGDNNIGNVDIVTLPAKKLTYAASSALTQTNLDGLADSATHVAGWESGAIDNSSNLYLDYRINAVLKTEGAAVTAGSCKMWLVAEMDDSTWPDVFDGTESAETVTDTEQRDQICKLAATAVNDTGTAENVYLTCPSVAYVFNGVCPRKFVIFITNNTGTTLETTGDPNQVYVAGVYLT